MQFTVNIYPINGVIFQGMQYIEIALIATHPPSGAYIVLNFELTFSKKVNSISLHDSKNFAYWPCPNNEAILFN